MEVKTRRQAAEANDKKYWTGTPCSRGHNCGRWVSNGSCVDCVANHQRKFQKDIKAVGRRLERMGLKPRLVHVHDDHWLAVEAMIAELNAGIEAAYIANNLDFVKADRLVRLGDKIK